MEGCQQHTFTQTLIHKNKGTSIIKITKKSSSLKFRIPPSLQRWSHLFQDGWVTQDICKYLYLSWIQVTLMEDTWEWLCLIWTNWSKMERNICLTQRKSLSHSPVRKKVEHSSLWGWLQSPFSPGKCQTWAPACAHSRPELGSHLEISPDLPTAGRPKIWVFRIFQEISITNVCDDII